MKKTLQVNNRNNTSSFTSNNVNKIKSDKFLCLTLSFSFTIDTSKCNPSYTLMYNHKNRLLIFSAPVIKACRSVKHPLLEANHKI